MNQQAYLLHKSLKNSNDIEEIVQKVDSFCAYLNHLCNDISSNGLKSKFIKEWTFKTEINKEKDYENYCKANLFSAAASLVRIREEMNGISMNNVTRRMLSDFVCDLKPFVNYFDKDHYYSWLEMNTNVHITNFYYSLSKNVFLSGEPGEHEEEKLALASSTPFSIRQCIEYKVKRILGIDYWLINDKYDINTISKCFKIIKNNKPFYKTRNIDFDLIKKIHAWTSVFIHGGYRPEPWRTETALHCLNDLFYKGETSKKNSFSMYAGIEVYESVLPKLIQNTEQAIKYNSNGKVEIIWLIRPEVAIIKNK